MSSQLNSRSIGLALLSLAWAAFLTLVGSPEVLLFTIPVFMLAAPLAFGHYPGEKVIECLADLCFGRGPRVIGAPAARCSRHDPLARGGELIAARLAGRGPPLSN